MNLSQDTINSYITSLQSLKNSPVKTEKTHQMINAYKKHLIAQADNFERMATLKPNTISAREYFRLSHDIRIKMTQ